MASNRIITKSYLNIRNEYEAQEGIRPGQPIELRANNKVELVDVVSSPLTMIAVEDELQGKTINDAYVAGNMVIAWTPTSGDEGLILLSHATNSKTTFARGAYIALAANGIFVAVTAFTDTDPVAVMLEAVELAANGGSGTVRGFGRVRFI